MSMTSQPERSDFIRNLGDAASKNPISAALIGIGALWLFTNRNESSLWRSGEQALREGATATVGSARDLGVAAVDNVSEAGKAVANSAKEYVAAAPDTAHDLLVNTRTNLEDLFQSQPLALGAIGIAIGAAVAASFPTSATEDNYLGESSDYVKRAVGEIANKQTESAVNLGRKVVDAVADEARQQGLTVERFSSGVGELTDKISRVVSSTRPAKT